MAAYETIGQSDDWHTPLFVFTALAERFDLDVASPVEGPRYVPADRWLHQSGETAEWSGFVWMNPPFGHQASKRIWLDRFFTHPDGGIALVPDRTSAPWWQEAAPRASAVLFMAGKIKFERPDGSYRREPGNRHHAPRKRRARQGRAAALRPGLRDGGSTSRTGRAGARATTTTPRSGSRRGPFRLERHSTN